MSEKNRKEDDDNATNKTYLRRDTYFGPIIQYTSTMACNLQQLQTELHEQHRYEKHTLTELNQRFHIFIDRIQSLQIQNTKYIQAIEHLRRQSSSVSTKDIEENYFSLKSNYLSIRNTQIDSEWDLKLFQLQIEIYQRLIQIQDQSRNKKILALEDELKQSTSTLLKLRISYEQVEENVDYLYSENKNLSEQYLILTSDWCNMKKQQNKSVQSIEILKNSLLFYKTLHSNVEKSSSLFISSEDNIEFWRLALNEIIKKIRSDFEVFYGKQRQQMIEYYQTKMNDLEIDIQEALHHQQIQIEEFENHYQLQLIEYEKIQENLSYEKEVFSQLERTYSKLETEYQSIQHQHEEKFQIQSKDFESIRENIIIIDEDINELRRNKTNLELEILIYRQLLESNVTTIPSTRSERTENVVAKRLTIIQCASDGTYIDLINTSKNKTIDISKWILTQHIGKKKKIRFSIPDGIQLMGGEQLRIYSKSGVENQSQSSSNKTRVIVNNNISSWGISSTVETCLFNQKNEEEATALTELTLV